MRTWFSCLSMLAVLWIAAARAEDSATTFARDRRAILEMAGHHQVRFDFRETVAFVPDYQPIAPKASGGYETVLVIEDTGKRISLQHLLIVGTDGTPRVVKHWRQTWEYEPREVLVYSDTGTWQLRPVPRGERRGAWSQTVWQTDDSPRYGAIGRWRYDNGVPAWTSDATLRPLARRDAVRRPVYDRYLGSNRQALTPAGWVHEQDNAKLGRRGGNAGLATFVHEVVTNTYTRSTAYDPQPAVRYWQRTQDYWAQVRAAWEQRIRRERGLAVREDAESGSRTGAVLMDLAERLDDAEISVAAAVQAATAHIDEHVARAAAAAAQ